MLKKILANFIIAAFLIAPAFATDAVSLDKQQNKKLNLKPVDKKISGSIVINDQETLNNLVKIQQADELKDLDSLWKATVEKNDLIKFTLKKLNTPESQRRLHSSLMAKGLSAIVYGATFLPCFMGADSITRSASFTTGRLANNYINKNSAPQVVPLTDTELIELAGMIENLQDTLISNYYNYKGSLTTLKDTRSRLILYNKNYANAIQKNDKLEITISSALYDDMVMQEFSQEQTAKKYYMELERLAGKETVDKLNLSQYALKNQLVNPQAIKKDKKL